MKKDNYGVYITFGNFKSGKSFGTSIDIVKNIEKLASEGRELFVISNNPNYFCDLYYSSPSQLFQVIQLLEKYSSSTNDDLLLYYLGEKDVKDIVLVVDESHLYFDSRKYSQAGGLIDTINLLLTQSRKRKIRFEIITQRPSSIDVRFRRLADFIIKYKRIKLRKWSLSFKYLYLASGDSTYVEDPTDHDIKTKLLSTSIFRANSTIMGLRDWWLTKKEFQKLQNEEYLTWHIVGLPDDNVYIPSLEEFLQKIYIDRTKTDVIKSLSSDIINNG